MEQAGQPEWELTVDGERPMDQEEEVETNEVCNGLGEEGRLGLRT